MRFSSQSSSMDELILLPFGFAHGFHCGLTDPMEELGLTPARRLVRQALLMMGQKAEAWKLQTPYWRTRSFNQMVETVQSFHRLSIEAIYFLVKILRYLMDDIPKFYMTCDVKFSVAHSSKGIDMEIVPGGTVHVPKHFSAHRPVFQTSPWRYNQWPSCRIIHHCHPNIIPSAITVHCILLGPDWPAENWYMDYSGEDDDPGDVKFSTLFSGEDDDSGDVKFSVAHSSDGIHIEIVSGGTVHVPKHSSAHHPLIQMVLFADKIWDGFRCPKSMVPESILLMIKRSRNAAGKKVPEFTPNGNAGRSFVSETGSQEDGTVLGPAGALDDNIAPIRGDVRADPIHLANLTLSRATNMDNPRPNGAPAIAPSAHKDVLHGRDPDPDSRAAAEHGTIKDKKTAATWLMATAAPHHATGNRGLLSDFTPEHGGLFLHAGDGAPMQVLGRGSVISDTVVLPDVWFVPGLTANLVSASQLTELDYSVGFGRGVCYVRSADDGGGALAGEARVGEDGLYALDFLKISHGM